MQVLKLVEGGNIVIDTKHSQSQRGIKINVSCSRFVHNINHLTTLNGWIELDSSS